MWSLKEWNLSFIYNSADCQSFQWFALAYVELYITQLYTRHFDFLKQVAVCKMPTKTTAAAAAATTKTGTKTTTLITTLHGSHLHTTIIVPIIITNNQSSYATTTITSGTTTCTTGGHFSRRMEKMPAKEVNWPWKFLWEDQFTSTVASACYMIRR